MKNIVFLSCDDLSGYVVDDEFLFKAIEINWPELNYDVISWSKPDVDWSKYDVAVIRTTWDYTKRRSEFLAKLAKIEKQGCKVLNPISVIEWNSHKSYLKNLEAKNISIIKSYFLDQIQADDLSALLQKDLKYVIKPIVGATAEHIQILNKLDMIDRVKNLQDPKNWFIQPYIEEILTGERSLFYFNSEFSHACLKVPKNGDFRVQEEHGGIISNYEPTIEDFNFAQKVLSAIDDNLLLYCRIDFLKTKLGPQLIELELIEPSLYFRVAEYSANNFIRALKNIKL